MTARRVIIPALRVTASCPRHEKKLGQDEEELLGRYGPSPQTTQQKGRHLVVLMPSAQPVIEDSNIIRDKVEGWAQGMNKGHAVKVGHSRGRVREVHDGEESDHPGPTSHRVLSASREEARP